MNNQNNAWYAALKAKDARFDGRFFVGVSSTGIYCRPICRARLPKRENCTFYTHAAAAEKAGFRPCLLCRPELAPGNAPVDASASLAKRAARLLEEYSNSEHAIKMVALRLGCSDRHLRRVFINEFNVSPIQYLQTTRLLLAKNLLTDTHLAIIDVAMAAGFGSLRRFNTLFKTRYHIVPSALRKETAKNKNSASEITLLMSYRPPYQWEKMLAFLAKNAIPDVEIIHNGEYFRTVNISRSDLPPLYGWIRVSHLPAKNALNVTMDSTLLPALAQLLALLRHLFDFDCHPDAVYDVLSEMNSLQPKLCVHGTRLVGCFDNFEMSVHTILAQQTTTKTANMLITKFVKYYGTAINTDIEGLSYLFPTADTIINSANFNHSHLEALGISSAQSQTIYTIAHAFASGQIKFEQGWTSETQIEQLMTISAIELEMAQYIAMRATGSPDIFLSNDPEIKKALSTYSEQQIAVLAQKWQPWRSYATYNLLNSL